ncbi:spermine/spermidine synthase domain-containing protein [Kordiimonas aquimaris]|uniref:spermine/spermidine synthase domain-containing protein n=1 Tax=Kordiimonas aquimaris TaxID=707591 RepID=UPI0021D3928E|nr:hypothetical protein [Kordiimonas aquimaris]
MGQNSQPSNASFKWWRERDDEFGAALSLNAQLLHSEQSPYQLIEIYDTAPFGRVLVLDGYVQASQADEFIYHEMAIHVPLLGREHEDANILIIGGGEGGALREALKHDFVSNITMVEIDKRVVELSSAYLGVNGDYDDPRVNLIIGDAATFADEALSNNETYDLILLDLTEPVGPSAALFTQAFCEKLVKLIKKDGVIVDSDSLYLSRAPDGTPQGSFLQEVSSDGENLVSVMKRTGLLPHIEVYHTKVPLYPGADFGFFLYSHHGESYQTPVKSFTGNHYNSALHSAAFALPEWQKRWINT